MINDYYECILNCKPSRFCTIKKGSTFQLYKITQSSNWIKNKFLSIGVQKETFEKYFKLIGMSSNRREEMKNEGKCKCIKDLKTKGGVMVTNGSEFEYVINCYDNITLRNKNIAFTISKVEFGDYFVGIVEENNEKFTMKGTKEYDNLKLILDQTENLVNKIRETTNTKEKNGVSFLGTNNIENCYLIANGPIAILLNDIYSSLKQDPNFDEMLNSSLLLYKHDNEKINK